MTLERRSFRSRARKRATLARRGAATRAVAWTLALACAAVANAQTTNAAFPGASMLPDALARQCAFETTASAPTFVPTLDFDEPTIVRAELVSDFAIAPYSQRAFGYFGGVWGSQDTSDGEADLPGFHVSHLYGGFGNDWDLFRHGIWGLGAQGGRVKLDPKNGATYETRVNAYSGNLHFSIFDALWKVDALIGLGRNRHKQRDVASGATNSFTASQQVFAAEFSAKFDKGYTRVEPFANFRIVNLSEPARAEKFLKSIEKTREFADASYRLKVGSRFSWEHATTLATLKPRVDASWSHEFGKRELYMVGESAPMPVAFRFGRHKRARDSFSLGGGVGAALRDEMDVYLQYDAQFAKDYSDYMFVVGFNKKY